MFVCMKSRTAILKILLQKDATFPYPHKRPVSNKMLFKEIYTYNKHKDLPNTLLKKLKINNTGTQRFIFILCT